MHRRRLNPSPRPADPAVAQSTNTSLEERIGQLQQQLTLMMKDVSVAQQREMAAVHRSEQLEQEANQCVAPTHSLVSCRIVLTFYCVCGRCALMCPLHPATNPRSTRCRTN